MRTLVTGAGGMLGLDVTDAAVARNHEVFALTRTDLDITDRIEVADAFAEIKPDVVINCAAYTDVDGAEANEDGAMAVNDAGASLVAGCAASVNCKIVHVSSDYVFDGEKGSPYVESDMPHAISAYGRSKQAGETSVAIENPAHFIVRSSWLYGARGPNFIETMIRIAGGQPEVVVVTDQVGSPTYTRHLADALVEISETEDYGLHHIAAGGQCSWYEFAQEIFDQADVDCRVLSGTTAMLGRPAPRPPFSVLRSERGAVELPLWSEGLSAYLAEREKVSA